MLGPLEITLLLFLVFLILGPKRIVSLFRALGRGVKDFTTEFTREEDDKELPEADKDELDKK